MLQGVHRLVVQRGFEERRNVPQPQRQCMQRPGRKRIGEQAPHGGPPAHLHRMADAPPPRVRKGPGPRGERARQHHQWRTDQHQDFVLHHVRGKKLRAQRIQRRHERDDQRQPAAGKAGRLRPRDPAPGAGVTPQAQHAAHVKQQGEGERRQHPGLEAEVPQHVVRAAGVGCMRPGGRRRHQEKQGDSTHAAIHMPTTTIAEMAPTAAATMARKCRVVASSPSSWSAPKRTGTKL